MPDFVYPTAIQMTATDPVVVADLTAADPIFRHFPPQPSDSAELVWEQRDSYGGLMQFRGYENEPKLVGRPGARRYRATPGVYGEFTRVNEEEMTRRAAYGRLNQRVDVGDLVLEGRNQLLTRQVQRVSHLLWSLVTTGQYLVPDELGAIVEYGGMQLQVYASTVAWSSAATATPLADFRNVSVLGRGRGTSFAASAVGYMNQTTANWLVANGNAADLGGRRTSNGGSVTGLGAAREVLAAEGAPQLQVYEGGYFDDAMAWELYIPDGIIVLFGQRANGGRIGEFRYTTNMVNPGGASTPYVRTVERGMRDNEPPPPFVEVHRGFNGGPICWFPGSILIMRVGSPS